MPRDFPDEFVVFPGSEYHTVKLSVGHDGSRDPSWPNESGRQHRPAEPGHDALRYVEDVEVGNASGPGHEREFSTVSVPTVTCGSPEALVNEPGKLVGFGTRVGSECSTPVAAMLNVTSALRKGLREYKQANGYELAPMDGLADTTPPPVPLQKADIFTGSRSQVSAILD